MTLRLLLAAATLAAVASPAAAATFNLFDAFNGSATGAAGSGYTFGYTNAGAFGGTLTGLDATCLTTDPNVQCANAAAAPDASVSKAVVNGGSYDIPGTGFYDTGELNFHPGRGGENSGFQFAAATSGNYSYAIGLSVNDTAIAFHSVDYRLFQGTTLLASGILEGGLTANLTGNANVGAGTIFTFLLGANGDFRYDSTGVTATFATASVPPVASGVPEPATWGLMLLGFGAVGAALRRTSPRAVRSIG